MDKITADAMARAAGMSIATLGLRFDRVALRVIRELTHYCDREVPDGARVLVTISAPIRFPARTTGALKQRIGKQVLQGAPLDQVAELNGNAIALRLVTAAPGSQPRFLGLVHNPGKDPRTLLDLAERYAENVRGVEAAQPGRGQPPDGA